MRVPAAAADGSPPDATGDDELARRIGDWITTTVFEAELETAAIDDAFAEAPSEPKKLRDLRPAYHRAPRWLLRISPKADERRLDESQLTVISEHPRARALRITGLNQATFERLIIGYGRQFTAIELEKCPLIADLSPLEDLPGLELVTFYRNQRATRLWNLSRNPRLTGLLFRNFTRLHDLSDLQTSVSLRELAFGDTLWNTSVFESLEPLAALGGLESLEFDAKRIDDGRIEPVAELTGLKELAFPASMFTTRQVAWLRARLPASLESESLSPVIKVRHPVEDGDKTEDVLLVGKRKPLLNSIRDAARIRTHTDEFRQMVEDFRRDPALRPD
jgi:hypothetical protein